VQDFKSSFKMVVSQGLRSATQAAGCAVALYSISPEMASVMLVIVPTVIGAGALIGSFLRSLSRSAQAQVAKATAVGEECISNVRTVRSFAMEEEEKRLYNAEVDKSRRLNETLGAGIGLFQVRSSLIVVLDSFFGGIQFTRFSLQAATNIFLNGVVLATLYYGGYLLSSGKVSAGDLMSFLVATQTIQRSVAQMSLLFGQVVKGGNSCTQIVLINDMFHGQALQECPLAPESSSTRTCSLQFEKAAATSSHTIRC
jgi:ATP-binding cassette subfamily B (MDR/TAP) protein 8